MSRLSTLLIAIVLGVACACLAASALAAGAPGVRHPAMATATRAATSAHTGGHHASKHARRASCRSIRNRHGRTHKGKHHQKRCKALSRGIHRQHSPPTGDAPTAAHKPSQAPHTHSAHTESASTSAHATPILAAGPPPAAVIASVLATPCQNTEAMPEPANLEVVKAATLCLVDQVRAHSNELPLQVNAQLEEAAQAHSEAMVGEDYFAHIAPSGETPLDRVQESGYIPNSQVGYTIGENIAWGTLYLATPSSIVAAWVASPEHLANILDGDYRDTGIGVIGAAPQSLAEGEAGAVYTQEFGVIRG